MIARRLNNERATAKPAGSPSRRSHGFTLVELAIVMAIIAMLASALLGALYSSQEKARADRTKATIAKLDSVIRSHWETYRTRRVNVARGNSEAARPFAARQLQARWDLQRAELPDRYDDICTPSGSSLNPVDPGGLNSSLQAAYIEAIAAMGVAHGESNAANYLSTTIRATNQSAECLYLVVTVGMVPEDEIKFLDTEIGDTDNDGMPEFIDGYGEPINFLRWAPGFISDIQGPDPVRWPDPLDPLGVGRTVPGGQPALLQPAGSPPDNTYGFLLYPLIYSRGPDGAGALMLLGQVDTSDPQVALAMRNPYSFYDYNGNPYQRGAYNAEEAAEGGGMDDNIHNHLLGSR